MRITVDRDRYDFSLEGTLRKPDISLQFNTSYFRLLWNPDVSEAPTRSGYSGEENDEGDMYYHNFWIGGHLVVWTTKTKSGIKRISRYKRWRREKKRKYSYQSWKKEGYEWDCKVQDRDEIMVHMQLTQNT